MFITADTIWHSSYLYHNSPIYEQCQTRSGKVLALPCWAHQDNFNNNPQPICNFGDGAQNWRTLIFWPKFRVEFSDLSTKKYWVRPMCCAAIKTFPHFNGVKQPTRLDAVRIGVRIKSDKTCL